MPRLKIDLSSGVLEVEGEESFVREIYENYKDKLTELKSNEVATPTPIPSPAAKPTVHDQHKKNKSNGSRRKESFQIVKDLDLSKKGERISLREFYEQKAPSNGMQKSAVFVYYLERIAQISGISIDHIYTCYKDVGEKVPGALRQSLLDTSSRKGYVDTKSMNDIRITVQGENLVEHDLPQKEAGK